MPHHGQSGSFRQLLEKQISVAQIDLMLWSPCMDVIALSTKHGEVLLYRLMNWQKVWTQTSPSKDIKVTEFAWRPDGKVLAVGYTNGTIVLYDVENSEQIHTLSLSEEGEAAAASEPSVAVTMSWVLSSAAAAASSVDDEPNSTRQEAYQDLSAEYLPRLLSLSKNYGPVTKAGEENVEDTKRLRSDVRRLNLLAVGTSGGSVRLYALGMFPCASVRFDAARILSVGMTRDLATLVVVTSSDNGEEEGRKVEVVKCATAVLHSHQEEILALALKYSKVWALLDYLDLTVKAIAEAWEDVLLEIDVKLAKFAEEKDAQGEDVCDDFLELLMFGTPSTELEFFLLHTLTEKGLKKLGHSIEMSYSNIQKLVLKHLQSVGHALVYHLSHMKGMMDWEERFGALSEGGGVGAALSEAGSFVLKTLEIQQVIDQSMRNFKAVFRWLYGVILRLSDEHVPQEITKVTQQDLLFVAQFIQENFSSAKLRKQAASHDTGVSGFSLERVGQYLKNEPLTIAENNSSNPWIRFLAQNPEFERSHQARGNLFRHDASKSLLQQHATLLRVLEDAFHVSKRALSNSITVSASVPLRFASTGKEERFELVIGESELVLLGDCGARTERFYLYRLGGDEERSIQVNYSTSSSTHFLFLDVHFYDRETLSVLTCDPARENSCVLVQVPIATLLQRRVGASDVIDLGDFSDSLSQRLLENVKGFRLAVSGSRNVACVLFASRRRVRLFDMDVEEEEDDDEDDAVAIIDAAASRDNSGSDGNDSMLVEENKENVA